MLLAYWALITLAGRAPDSSRYILVGAIMLLLVGAELLRGRPWGGWALIAFVIAIAIALPANVMKLDDGRSAQVIDADATRALGMRVENAVSVEAALPALSRLAYEVPPRILISGSLYLACPVLDINGTPPA